MISWNEIENWQSLIGAIVGAAIPVIISLFLLWLQKRQEFKRKLQIIDVLICNAITDLYACKKDIELFLYRSGKMIEKINDSGLEEYFFTNTNFPVTQMGYSARFLDLDSRSLYLTNKLLFCHKILKDIDFTFSDLQFELRLIMKNNHDRILASKAMDLSVKKQKELLLAEVVSIRKTLQESEGNISVAVKALINAREYLVCYSKAPTIIRWWNESSSFFLTETPYTSASLQERIESRFKSRVENTLSETEKRYVTQWK